MISAAMFVKNEGLHIEKCIRSVAPLVDEIVLVDTGSDDGTLYILAGLQAELGADFLRIYEESWRSDFSWHRNHVAGLANNDILLVIDGDEWVHHASSPDVLRHQARKMLAEGHSATQLFITLLADGGTSHIEGPRLYDRTKCVYKLPVHNQLVVFEGTMDRLPRSEYEEHSNYQGTQESKLERSIPMLLKALETEEDQQLRMVLLYYIVKSYYIKREYEEAIKYADLIPIEFVNTQTADLVEWVAYSLLATRGHIPAISCIETAIRTCPDAPVLWRLRAALSTLVWYVYAREAAAEIERGENQHQGQLEPILMAPEGAPRALEALGSPIALQTVRKV